MKARQQKCGKAVADHTGYHFHTCNKPAKWLVGTYGLRCGLHAKGKFFEALRKPIEQPKSH